MSASVQTMSDRTAALAAWYSHCCELARDLQSTGLSTRAVVDVMEAYIKAPIADFDGG